MISDLKVQSQIIPRSILKNQFSKKRRMVPGTTLNAEQKVVRPSDFFCLVVSFSIPLSLFCRVLTWFVESCSHFERQQLRGLRARRGWRKLTTPARRRRLQWATEDLFQALMCYTIPPSATCLRPRHQWTKRLALRAQCTSVILHKNGILGTRIRRPRNLTENGRLCPW